MNFLYFSGCESGFKLNANNRTCDDIDECEVHKTYKLCVGICENIPGSYRCACGEGYRIGADSRSCEGEWKISSFQKCMNIIAALSVLFAEVYEYQCFIFLF